jgi:hypothetical protein
MDCYEVMPFRLFNSDSLPISGPTFQWTRPTESRSCNSIGESIRSESEETSSVGGDVDSEMCYEDMLSDVDLSDCGDDHWPELIEIDLLHSSDGHIRRANDNDQRSTEEEWSHLRKDADLKTHWLLRQLMKLKDLVCDYLHMAKGSSCLVVELRAFQDTMHQSIDDQQVITQLNAAIDMVCDANFALISQQHNLWVHCDFHEIEEQISVLTTFFTAKKSKEPEFIFPNDPIP